jgi:hypothetical protein
MKPARQTPGTVVQLTRPPQSAAHLPMPTTSVRLPAWTDSWADEPAIHLPDMPAEIIDQLPAAVAQARSDLAPGDAGEVLAALSTLASRRGFPLPDDVALEMDVEVMAGWPRDLWRKAFRAVWEQFSYRRLPEVADFRKYIAADLEERRGRLDRLESLRLKLETVRLKRQWDEESRARRCR